MIRALERDPFLKRNVIVTPASLEDLRDRCGEWGAFAVTKAIWVAVAEWARQREKAKPDHPNSFGLTEAVALYSEMVAEQEGHPTISGGERVSTLGAASAHMQRTRRAHALWAKAEWEREGRPGMGGAMLYALGFFYECERATCLREEGR